MREIFEMQWRLNIHTLANIGRDFVETIADPEQKPIWIENYRKALSAELAELVREVAEYGIGSANGKIEIIDIFHFLVSLSHIVDVQPEEAPPFTASSNGASFNECVIRTFLALDELQNSMKWKWWAKGGGYKPAKAKSAVLEIWESMALICGVFDMSFAEMKRIYTEKNRVNFERQNRNYNEDTKTEADNLAIKV